MDYLLFCYLALRFEITHAWNRGVDTLHPLFPEREKYRKDQTQE